MINVTIINLKSAMKYLVIVSILVIGIGFTRFFYNSNLLKTQIANVSLTRVFGCNFTRYTREK